MQFGAGIKYGVPRYEYDKWDRWILVCVSGILVFGQKKGLA